MRHIEFYGRFHSLSNQFLTLPERRLSRGSRHEFISCLLMVEFGCEIITHFKMKLLKTFPQNLLKHGTWIMLSISDWVKMWSTFDVVNFLSFEITLQSSSLYLTVIMQAIVIFRIMLSTNNVSTIIMPIIIMSFMIMMLTIIMAIIIVETIILLTKLSIISVCFEGLQVYDFYLFR